MVRKLLLAVVVAVAVVFALWRAGVLDTRRLSDQATELRDRGEQKAKEAAKGARDAIEPERR